MKFRLTDNVKFCKDLEILQNDEKTLTLDDTCKIINRYTNSNIEPISSPYRINLMEDCMIFKGFGVDWDFYYEIMDYKNKKCWYAQEQLEALDFYTNFDGYGIIADGRIGGYQGEYYAIIEHKDFIFLWRDSFGSCSGCDGLDGCDAEQGYRYIKQTLSEGNTLQFWSLEQARCYVKEIKNDRYNYWQEFPMNMFDKAKDVMW